MSELPLISLKYLLYQSEQRLLLRRKITASHTKGSFTETRESLTPILTVRLAIFLRIWHFSLSATLAKSKINIYTLKDVVSVKYILAVPDVKLQRGCDKPLLETQSLSASDAVSNQKNQNVDKEFDEFEEREERNSKPESKNSSNIRNIVCQLKYKKKFLYCQRQIVL